MSQSHGACHDSAAEIEARIQNHPFIASLRANPSLRETRYYSKFPDSVRARMFTAGGMLGPDKLAFPPWMFYEDGGAAFYMIFYLGDSFSGYPGMAHGGALATIFDEGFAGCASAAVPEKVAATMALNVRYRKPAKTNTLYCLKARASRVEGRFVWVEGQISSLDEIQTGNKSAVVTEGDGQFVQPIWTQQMYSPL